MPKRSETAGGEYPYGTSDNPQYDELPKRRAASGRQAESRELNPEQNAIMKELLEEISNAESIKDAVKVKELNMELDEELVHAGIDRDDLRNLFGEYFEGEEEEEYKAVEGDEEAHIDTQARARTEVLFHGKGTTSQDELAKTTEVIRKPSINYSHHKISKRKAA